MRSENEIRAEIEYQKRIVLEHRAARRFLDAAWGAIVVAALAWVLNESKSPTHRVKIGQ